MYKRILAAAIIILVAFAYVQWGMDYIYAYEWEKTAPDRESLVNEKENIMTIINQPVTVDETLGAKLADLQGKIEQEKAKFPEDVYITNVVDQLLHLAQETGIGIIPLNNGDWSKTRDKSYEMYQIQLIITGTVDDVIRFVDRVEAEMLYSINVKDLEISGESIGPGGTVQADAVQGYVTVTIYKRA